MKYVVATEWDEFHTEKYDGTVDVFTDQEIAWREADAKNEFGWIPGHGRVRPGRRVMIDKAKYDEIARVILNAQNNTQARPAVATAQALIAIATIFLEEAVNHDGCVRADDGDPRGHLHDGMTGRWIWPDEVGKGLYDESPTGA